MAVINKRPTGQCWRGCREMRTLLHCWWECRLGQPLWKAVWGLLRTFKIKLPYDSAVWVLEIYQKTPQTLIWQSILTSVFIAALLSIAKLWEWPKSPSTYEQTKGWWYTYTMKYLAIEKNVFGSMDGPRGHCAKWNNQWDWERQVPYDFTYMWNLKKKTSEQRKLKQTHRYRNHTGGARGEEAGGTGRGS